MHHNNISFRADDSFLKMKLYLNPAVRFQQIKKTQPDDALINSEPVPGNYYLSVLTSHILDHPVRRLCYMKLSERLKNILQNLGAGKTVDEISQLAGTDKENMLTFLKMLYLNDYLLQAGIVKYPSSPESASLIGRMGISVTGRCNLRCVYCYAAAGDVPATDLFLNQAFSGIDHFFQYLPSSTAVTRLTFIGGGEPTCAFPLVKQCYDYFTTRTVGKNMKAGGGMVTNGNFGMEALEWLIRENFFVTFSIDGPADIHDCLRPMADGRGSFKKAAQNLASLASAGNKVNLRATVTHLNVDHLDDIIKLAYEHGVSMVHLEQCLGSGRASVTEQNLAVAGDELVPRLLEAFYLGLKLGINVKLGPLRSLMPGSGYYCGDKCNIYYGITPRGYISACAEVNMENDAAGEVFLYGKIDDEGKVNIDQEKLKVLASRHYRNIPECRDCFLGPNCAGGCPVKSYVNHGSLFCKDSGYCKIIKTINEQIIERLLSGEIKPSTYLQPHRVVLGKGYAGTVPGEHISGTRYEEHAVFVSFNPPGAKPRLPGASLEERLLFPWPKDSVKLFFGLK